MPAFTTTRHYPILPTEVFAAIATPQRLARWWGPSGFTNRFHAFDFREGGRWVFDMVGPDGAVYPNTSEFTRIVPGREVVVRHDCAPHFTLAISLEPAPGGTLLKWEQAFDDPAVAQAVAHIVVPANEQNLDRLGEELAAQGR